MVRLNAHDVQVFDSTNGFHSDRDRVPWELRVPPKLVDRKLKSVKLSDTDLLMKEKQSHIQYGFRSAPETVISRIPAPIELYSGGTYQGGNQFMEKMERMRDRRGLDQVVGNPRRECEGIPMLKIARNAL